MTMHMPFWDENMKGVTTTMYDNEHDNDAFGCANRDDNERENECDDEYSIDDDTRMTMTMLVATMLFMMLMQQGVPTYVNIVKQICVYMYMCQTQLSETETYHAMYMSINAYDIYIYIYIYIYIFPKQC